LDPERSNGAILQADLIVELHHILMNRPENLESLKTKFDATHHFTLIPHNERNPHTFDFMESMSHLDKLLCCWEFRPCPTPWGTFIRRQGLND
jgi:hypothetical protein